MSRTKAKEPGTFRWQDDPNYRGPVAPPPPTTAPTATPVSSGPSVLDYAVAAKGMRDTNKTNGKPPARGKGSAWLTDAAGSVVGAFSDDAGNQIQSRAAGMRMKSDSAQAQSARDAYVQAFNATDDEALKQQYADAAANIAKGASIDVPKAVQGVGSTLAGTLAEGTSKAVPLLVGLGLSGLKDGGVVRGGRDAMSDEESRKEFSRAFNQPG